jgi:hypothetical protein
VSKNGAEMNAITDSKIQIDWRELKSGFPTGPRMAAGLI